MSAPPPIAPEPSGPQSGPIKFAVRSPRFPRRFGTRVFLYVATLSLATSAVSAVVYYTRQLGFIETDRARRARTLLTSLATQAELGAYAGDAAMCDLAARRTFSEDDVLLVAIYDRRGREILRFQSPALTPPPPAPEVVARMTRDPDARPERHAAVDKGGEGYDDLYAPIVTGSRDPEEALAAGPSGRTPLREVVGVARVGLSQRPARAQLEEVIRWGAYLAVGLLVVGIGAALLISRRISRPIAALTRGVDQLRQGVLDARVEIESQDEIGQLAESFNRMADRLRESIKALEALNRDLEVEVGRRTTEIQRAAAFSALLNAPLGPQSAPPRVHSPSTEVGGAAAGNLGRLLDDTLVALIEGTGARAGAVLLSREESVDFDLEVARYRGAPADAFGTPPSHDALADPKVTLLLEENRLTVPLLLGDEPQGCLVLCEPEVREDALRFAVHAAAQLAIAVGNLRAYAAAAHLARALEERNGALARQRDQLQAMNRLKSEFLASISHELRTPLNAIIGYSELITDGIYGDVNVDQRSALSGIDESGRNLLSLINQILDLSKIEAGKMTVHLEDVDVVEIVSSVLAEAAPLAKDRPYKVQLLPGDRVRLRTDGPKVKQIVTNLVSNAIKFTAHGNVNLQIRAESGGGCTIAIQDTGIGIRAEDMTIIFEEFRQVDGSYTRAFGGTGLGLAIAKRFAELLGGQISVASTVDVGSTFTIHLPREAPALPATPPRRLTLPPPVPADARREVKPA
ncbi:MAG: HAMP domain-containing protein [Myxococcales bacterium]|nr:HAMP domain-containing protein [Myxococcales bacterium]